MVLDQSQNIEQSAHRITPTERCAALRMKAATAHISVSEVVNEAVRLAAISEKHGNERGAASTYAQLGLLASKSSQQAKAGEWLLKAVMAFAGSNDQHNMARAMKVFAENLQAADPDTQAALRQGWQEAGLDQHITLDQLERQRNDD